MADEKEDRIIQQFKDALRVSREAKACGEIAVSVKVHEGGIRNAQVTVQRQVV